MDKFDSKINFKNVNQLEFQIVKNNQIIVPWNLVSSNEKKTEVFSPIKNLPKVKSTFYDLFKTKLKNGDVVKFFLRKKNSKQTLFFHNYFSISQFVKYFLPTCELNNLNIYL